MLRTVLEERSEAKISDLVGRALHILQFDGQTAASQQYWESKWVSKVKERAFFSEIAIWNKHKHVYASTRSVHCFVQSEKNNII